MSNDKIRAEFEEAFHQARCQMICVAEDRAVAWAFFLASREALVIEMPIIVGYEGVYDNHKDHEFVPRISDVDDADEVFGLCRSIEVMEALEAAGLKVMS